MVKYKIIENSRRKDNNIETFLLQKNKDISANRYRGLYFKFLIRLKEAQEEIPESSRREYLPYSIVFAKVCRNFSITKDEAREILFLLREFGLLKIIKFKGISLKYDLKDSMEVKN